MSGTRFEVKKFDGIYDFELCRIEIKALLVEHDLQAVLEGESKPPVTLSLDEKIVMGVTNIDIKIKGRNHALLLLSIMSETYERFVITMLYGRMSITLEDVKAALNSKELLKKVIGFQGSDGEGPIMKGKIDCRRQNQEGGRTLMTDQTCDIDETGRVGIEMCDGSECKSTSQVKVEPCAKATSWKKVEFGDLRALEPQFVVIENVSTRRFEGGNIIYGSSRTRERQGKQSKPLKKIGLGELVVFENPEVASKSTCLVVSESSAKISTKPGTFKKLMGGLDSSGAHKNGGGAHRAEFVKAVMEQSSI
ncbi:hypothetical protein CRG98_042395 [Punica granatum]|uniref:Uncharacterized protein n=1 Tax=Punica granatum TaxID=22663 RepID=A0A2I0HZQ8_PUNGR|nr:hypothetical protein CRG98_042395 [Punica granatum]